MWLITFFVYI